VPSNLRVVMVLPTRIIQLDRCGGLFRLFVHFAYFASVLGSSLRTIDAPCKLVCLLKQHPAPWNYIPAIECGD
jgi:hypothetical protein